MADGTTSVLPNNFSLPAIGGVQFSVNNPSTPTTVRLTGAISGGASGQIFTLAESNATNNQNNILILDNAFSTFTGTILLNRGTLAFTSDGALGNPANPIRHDTWNLNGSLRFDANNITLNAARQITLVSANNVMPFNTQTFNGSIAGPITGPGDFVKEGTGTLVLNNASITYTGTTTVNAGTLKIDGAMSSSATATVLVNAGTTLSGSGSVIRPVTCYGTIAPGGSPGTLTTGATSLFGTLAIDLSATSSDKLSVTGNLTLGAASTLTVNLLSGGFSGTSCIIAECTGTLSGTFSSAPAGYVISYTSNQIILSHIPGYALWAAAKGLDGSVGKESGFTDDPDHDGIPNGIEFVLDGNPLASDHAHDPTIAVSADHITFTFTRRDDAVYLNPHAEFASNLTGPWTAVSDGVNGSVAVQSNGSAPDTVTVTIPRGNNPRMFVRLSVTNP